MDLLDAILTGHVPAEVRSRIPGPRTPDARGMVARLEDAVRRDPRASIAFDPTGLATVEPDGRGFCGGRFGTPSIAELRTAALGGSGRPGRDPGRVTFSVIKGGGPLADIGALQAMAAGGTLFQLASQFNCLEAPSSGSLARVGDYFSDPTQGPRAAISAFPGTLVRHYAAPDGAGGRFVQTRERQLGLLADALPAESGRVKNGYLRASWIADVEAAAAAFERDFDLIRVGVHDEVEVVLGADWDGAVEGRPRVAQVLTSTLDASGTKVSGATAALCRSLLRAAYLGTMLAAVVAGKRRVLLTMIGGGAFANPHGLILEALLWAVDEVSRMQVGPLAVVLNRHASAEDDRDRLRAECEARGGVYRTTR